MHPGAAEESGGALHGLSDLALLERISRDIDTLQAQALDGSVDDQDLRNRVVALQRCESMLYAEKLRCVAEVDERQAFRGAAHRSTPDWLADASGLSPNEARRQAGVATALTRLRGTAQQLASGKATAGHADAAAAGLRELDAKAKQRRQDAGGDVELWLAEEQRAEELVGAFDAMVADVAPNVDRAELSRRIDAWTISNDPDTIEDREARTVRMRGSTMSATRDRNGLWTQINKLTDLDKAQLEAAMGPLSRKTPVDDERTPAQRNLDALVGLAQRACDSGDLPTVAAQRPHMLLIRTVNATGEDVQAPLLEGVGPVSGISAALLACDAETTAIARRPDGTTFDVSLPNGDPSKRQRLAVIARDKRCVGCGAPATRCHIHHIRWRSKGGPTLMSNLVLVCWSCHQGIHHLGWAVSGDEQAGFVIDRRPSAAACHSEHRDTG